MYLLQHCKVAKLNRLHQIFRCIIIKVTSNKILLDKNFFIRILMLITKILPLAL